MLIYLFGDLTLSSFAHFFSTNSNLQVRQARHLCAVCPTENPVIGFDWNSNNADHVQACCPSRKIVTRTVTKPFTRLIHKTRTVKVVRTSTFTSTQGKRQVVSGRLFYDVNR